jgi:cytochrome c-type biogenesis protein CcmE
MKKTYIIGVAMIVLAIIVFISASKDMSTYATFAEATKTGKTVKIAGTLLKDMEMIYEPAKDPNFFSFYMMDAKGGKQKVVLLKEKPQDFELSEQIVLTGKMNGDEFVASDMLLKCPSKYKDEELELRQSGS